MKIWAMHDIGRTISALFWGFVLRVTTGHFDRRFRRSKMDKCRIRALALGIKGYLALTGV